jgi:RING finger and CHY zinc finger domain-containing protein 1
MSSQDERHVGQDNDQVHDNAGNQAGQNDGGENAELKSLRAQIMEIQRDTSTPPREKARRTQLLLSGGYSNSSITRGNSNDNSGASSSSSSSEMGSNEQDKEAAYKDEENKVLGCEHYARGCKIKAACCGRYFVCRWCHDAAVSDHKIDRYATELMICMHCGVNQPFASHCANKECGRTMGCYYCGVCKFVDATEGKDIYHCDKCRICRIGRADRYFHCDVCVVDLLLSQHDHVCIPDNLKSNCPICSEYMFTSRQSVMLMNCGHSIHIGCYQQAVRQGHHRCPLCNKTIVDLDHARRLWRETAALIEANPMPTEFDNTTAEILCNDCVKRATIKLHFFGNQCPECESFNTTTVNVANYPTDADLRSMNAVHTHVVSDESDEEEDEEESEEDGEEEEEEEAVDDDDDDDTVEE